PARWPGGRRRPRSPPRLVRRSRPALRRGRPCYGRPAPPVLRVGQPVSPPGARSLATRPSPPPLLRPIACAYPRSRMAGHAVEAPMQGTIVSVDVRPGDVVHPGQQLLVIESMKMEHVIAAETAGQVVEVTTGPGDTVNPGDVLIQLDPVAASPFGGDDGAI